MCSATCNVTGVGTHECPVCGSAIAEGVPMARQLTWVKRARSWASTWGLVCVACVASGRSVLSSDDGQLEVLTDLRALRADPEPCACCRRPVLAVPDKRRRVMTCSSRCRSRYYSQQRVTDAGTHLCEGCGAQIGGRSDRKFCSAACRQRAYRGRITG